MSRDLARRKVGFEEIFILVVKMSSIHVVLGIAASLDLKMDVKIVFLYGDLEKEIYMEQLQGFKVKGKKKNYFCRLKKSLYVLKQRTKQWYKKFELVMEKQGYNKTTSDHCVFVQRFLEMTL